MGWITLVGAAISAIGQISSANAQSKQLKFDANIAIQNSTIALQNASREREAADVEESLQRDRLRRSMGAANTARAKSGVTQTGSSLFVEEESMLNGELDALLIRHKGTLAENNYKSQAATFQAQSSQLKSQAKNVKKAGFIGAAGTLLTGAASAGMGSSLFKGAAGKGTVIPASGGNAGYTRYYSG